MATHQINEREFELINIIGANLALSQRDLSQRLSLSLGMTNILLKRLISKGYIRITQLNKRKVHYLLTSKGLSEKLRKSLKYTLKTIHSMELIKESLKVLLRNLHHDGVREYWLMGQTDLITLIHMVAKEINLSDCHFHVNSTVPNDAQGMVLICSEDTSKAIYPIKHINVVYEISKIQDLSTTSSHSQEG